MRRREWLAIVLAVVVAGLWMHPYRAQQASRYALTAAIADHGTIVLDDYEHVLGVDRAVRDGHLYSDKAPGQPVLAVPFYLVFRAVGGQPADVLQIDENIGLWWLTLWTSAIPLGLLTVVMRRYLVQRGHGGVAWPVALAMTYGTLLFPFGALLFGHVLTALFAFVMLQLADGEGATAWRLAAAGLVGGLAVLTEYTALLAVLPVTIYALYRHRRRAGWLLAGATPTAAALMAYNTVAFGGPFVLSYQYTAFSEVTDTARPALAVFRGPGFDNLIALLIDPRGLVLATPVVLVGMAGLIQLWRSDRARTVMIGSVVLAFLVLVVSWGNPWGGESPGARYLTPAIPFLAFPLAMVWQRHRRVALGTTLIGVVTMFSAVATEPVVPRDGSYGLGSWIGWLGNGDVAPLILGEGLIAVTVIAVCGLLLVVLIRKPETAAEQGAGDPKPPENEASVPATDAVTSDTSGTTSPPTLNPRNGA